MGADRLQRARLPGGLRLDLEGRGCSPPRRLRRSGPAVSAIGKVPPPRVDQLRRMMRRHTGQVDACIVGCGAAGAVLAKELAEGGWSVVVLEAGDWLDSREDFVNDETSMLGPPARDDLRIADGDEPLQNRGAKHWRPPGG